MKDLQKLSGLSTVPPKATRRSRLRYGVNEASGWREFALGPSSEQIRDRLRAIDTQILRVCIGRMRRSEGFAYLSTSCNRNPNPSDLRIRPIHTRSDQSLAGLRRT